MEKERTIYFYPLGCCDEKIKDILREKGIEIIDVRICKYVEIDAYKNEKIEEILGKPLFMKERKSFEELFFDTRFWEAHEVLEEKWKKEKDERKKKYLQSLILLSASMVKYCKGEKEVSDFLLNKALSLISELPEDLLPLFYISICLNA